MWPAGTLPAPCSNHREDQMDTQPQDWLGLGGRVCAITGAGGGIGRAVALGFARAGARVVLLDRNEASSADTAQLIADETDSEPVALACDVSDPANIEQAGAAVVKAAGPC